MWTTYWDILAKGGRRPELAGRGLITSLEGWEEVAINNANSLTKDAKDVPIFWWGEWAGSQMWPVRGNN